MSDAFGGSVARSRNRWGYRNPFLYPSKILTNKQLVNRIRTAWVPASMFTISNGAPALAVRGTNLAYAAWSMANGVVSGVIAHVYMPSDWASGTIGVDGVTVRSMQADVVWTNLGAGAGNVAFITDIKAESAWGSTSLNSVFGLSISSTPPAPAQDVGAAFGVGYTPAIPGGVWHTFRLRRDGTSGSDTLANAIGFLGINLSYIADM